MTDATMCAICGGPFSQKRIVIDGKQMHERCSVMSYPPHTPRDVEVMLRAAVAAEREACAALVSRLAADHGLDPESYAGYIRARGT